MRKIIHCLIIAAATALMFSCDKIKENFDDCPIPNNLRIIISANTNVSSESMVRYDEIGSVRVYIFDEVTGLYVTTVNGNKAFNRTQTYELTTQLPTGNYRFIVWTNQHELIYGRSFDEAQLKDMHFNDFNIFLNHPSGTLTTNLPDLHHGKKTQTIIQNQTNTVEILILPVTYKIIFRVEGLPVNTNNYRFTVTDDLYRRGFDNNVSKRTIGTVTNNFQYIRTATIPAATPNIMETSMIVIGLNDKPTRDLRFLLINTSTTPNQQLYPWNAPDTTGDLIDMIKRAYRARYNSEPDFGYTFEYIIPLKFIAGTGVTLDLEYWVYKPDPTPM